jgi:transposase
MKTMTHVLESTVGASSLLLAFELGERWWKLGFTTGLGQRARTRRIAAGAVSVLLTEIAQAKRRFGLPSDAPVLSCYEAGREGFWLHRYLTAHGVRNHVIDSSSIEVNRRARRHKTDQLDLGGLLTLLARYQAGDRRCWRVVRVPSVADEDARQLHRTRETLQGDRTRLINRLKATLATLGLRLGIRRDLLARVDAMPLPDGGPVPPGARERLARDWALLQAVDQQLADVDAERAALPIELTTPTGRAVQTLHGLRAIGPAGAWVLATEIFGWREIRNGRQLGALVGLVPAQFQSGESTRDRGITRAGNQHVRRLMVQLAWGWLRWQRTSALSQWYQRRFAGGGPRLRRIGIVALARKLLVALWRYVDHGIVPEGAVLKTATA